MLSPEGLQTAARCWLLWLHRDTSWVCDALVWGNYDCQKCDNEICLVLSAWAKGVCPVGRGDPGCPGFPSWFGFGALQGAL